MKHVVLVAAALAACAPAFALEPLKSFDNFSTPTLDPTRWATPERSIMVRNGQLNLVERNWSETTIPSAVSQWVWGTTLANPALVTEVRAKLTVNALEVNACATDAYLGTSRAYIFGSFFNAGTPVPGSMAGDVVAQVRAIRRSDSTDAPGVLRVEGVAIVCSDATCLNSTQIGTTQQLGTVDVGQAVTLEMQWDQPNKLFIFSRDPGQAGAVSATLPYTMSDNDHPGRPNQEFALRTDVPACMNAPRVSGYVDASFDNVYLNKFAMPLK